VKSGPRPAQNSAVMAIPTVTCEPRAEVVVGDVLHPDALVAEFLCFDMCNLGRFKLICAKHLNIGTESS